MVNPLSQLAKHAIAAVHEDSDLVRLNEVAAASPTSVLPSRGTADDCYAEYWEGLFLVMTAKAAFGRATVHYWDTLLRCTIS